MSKVPTPRRGWPIVVRRARPDDRDAVLAFASKTWNDWDYIPSAWPRWLEERDGVMLIATTPQDRSVADADSTPIEPGRPIAVVRVAMSATTEAWLEGIRVDPRVRGLEVASDLQVAELHWVAVNGARIVRYATSARNEGSHRLGARGGFEQVATLRGTWWSPGGEAGGHSAEEPSGFVPEVQADAQRRRRALLAAAANDGHVARPDESGALWEALSHDPTFLAGARLYEPRPWALEELTEAKFATHVNAGEVLRHGPGERDGLAILVADVAPAEDSALRFALLAGDPQAAFELIEHSREQAGEAIRFRYPDGAPLMSAVEERYRAAGYHFPDWALHVLARPLDDDHPAPTIDPSAVVLADPPEATIAPPR